MRKIFWVALFLCLPGAAWAQDIMVPEIKLGQYAMPVILMVLLSILYRAMGEERIQDRFRPLLAVTLGIGLGLIGLLYDGHPWTVVHIVDHGLDGLMVGASAIGLYELQKSGLNPR